MFKKWWSGVSADFKLLLLAWFFIGISQGLYDTTFNNYLNDIFHISTKVRGYLEFPREAPGFIVVIITGFLMFLPDVRMLGIAFGLVAMGLVGQSFYGASGLPIFGWMIVNMVIWSIGSHLFLPLSNSIPVRMAEPGKLGEILGVCNGANTGAYILGCALIWLLIGRLKFNYALIFRLAAFFAVISAVCLFRMSFKKPDRNKKFKLVFHKEYTLFYWLSILYGARKQVFFTFAPWVLVKIYARKSTTIATLLFFASLLGVYFKPWLGRMIDAVGERVIIIAESLLLIPICLGYGFAEYLGLGNYAAYLVYLCFIADNMLIAVSMARATYLHKNLIQEEDFTPTLSMGVSLDHAVAMTIPMLGGLLWETFGYEAIFVMAAGIAMVNIFLANKINDHHKTKILIRQENFVDIRNK